MSSSSPGSEGEGQATPPRATCGLVTGEQEVSSGLGGQFQSMGEGAAGAGLLPPLLDVPTLISDYRSRAQWSMAQEEEFSRLPAVPQPPVVKELLTLPSQAA